MESTPLTFRVPRPRRPSRARKLRWLLLLPALGLVLLALAPAPVEGAPRARNGGPAAKARAAPAKSAPTRKRKPAPRRPPPSAPARGPSVTASDDPAPAPGVAATTTTSDSAASAASSVGEPARPRAPGKPRVYTFGGLDLEGKLKTPQLLYFRSRMRQELDTSSPPRRSFLKELEETADAKGL